MCNFTGTSTDRAKYDDSDLMSVENWKGKGSELPHIGYEDESTEQNETYNFGQLIGAFLSPVLEEANDEKGSACKVTDSQGSDHSYCKPIFDCERRIYTTESKENTEYSYGKFVLNVNEKHFTSSPNTAVETDSNKASMTKRKTQTKGKYFRNYPEIRQRNKLLGLSKKPSLLPNGLICPPVKIDGKSYLVKKTCAFDSVVQILMTAAIDNVEYGEFLRISTNPTLQLINSLTEFGLKQKTYVERARILIDVSKISKCIETEERIISFNMDAEINIANMLKHILASAPSVVDTAVCSQCQGGTNTSVVIAPNQWYIGRHGFIALEKALEFYPQLHNVQCLNVVRCGGKVTITRKPQQHIFIELDVRPNTKCSRGLRCRLNQLPETLQLQIKGQESEHAQYR